MCVFIYGKLVYFRANGFSKINESHLGTVDISKPVILAEIAPDRYNIIDGNHSMEKAKMSGEKYLPAYKLTVGHHINFLIDIEAYLEYVKYWNRKL